MKIGMADNCGLKFSNDLKDHWQKLGHEVRFERGASEYIAQWADLYYVDWWDNNIHYLYKLYHDDPSVSRPDDWDNNKKPIIAVRAIDWEVWQGQARDPAIIEWVDKVICIAPHIEELLLRDGHDPNKLKLIRPGVNLDKFTLKERKTDGYQIGMVLGDMWWPKNHMGGLDIFKTLIDKSEVQKDLWHLHIRGQHEGGTEFWKAMFDHYIESRGLEGKVTLYSPIDDMNAWYEQIDVLLHPGMKEAFCYAVGEAAAKGIPIVCNEFLGSRDIWPDSWLYQTNAQAIAMIRQTRQAPNEMFREFMKLYSLEKYFRKTDEWLGVK